MIQLKSNSNEVIVPAILQLSREESQRFNQSDCFVRFSSSEGMVVGIDNISIGSNNNKSCDDFIEIIDEKSNATTKWCNKTDNIGMSFSAGDNIDVVFHAGSDSNSSFRLVITPYKGIPNALRIDEIVVNVEL